MLTCETTMIVVSMAIWDSFMTFMDRGGIFMWPLLVLSVVAFAVAIERSVFWFRVHGRRGLKRYTSLVVALRAGDRTRASALVYDDRSPYCQLTSDLLETDGDDAMAVAATEETRPRFERGLVILSTVVTAAPMLGILGTVVGIIQSFELLGGDASISDPRQVSGGIAEALITTACGLVVALLALFPYMLFRGQQERAIGRMESLVAAAIRGLRSEPEQPSAVSSSPKPSPEVAEMKSH